MRIEGGGDAYGKDALEFGEEKQQHAFTAEDRLNQYLQQKNQGGPETCKNNPKQYRKWPGLFVRHYIPASFQPIT